ncbi:ATP-dependent DNA ligase [Flexivirga meconopsidis]|uniref:ATP-dependent DNA ligase n=1 Tax=Flexivirga meconopsidis TaxID=2977121 RepID=UPI00223EBA96|nr:ATP-dependent DNA ligase [Flexivirga meconopsidis]
MDLPLELPITPMLAKATAKVPAADSVDGGMLYEPKWDGFRCILLRDGDEIELASRGSKPLTRYFPELVAAARDQLPDRCALDGEVVVRSGADGAARLDFEALGQRIHPAESRITKLSQETPAEIIFFDALVVDGKSLLDAAFEDRREALVATMRGVGAPFHVTRVTDDAAVAEDWFSRFEGAGLDGVVAKPKLSSYQPGKRTMLKIKHSRTAEAVLIGYRIHKSGNGVGSLLLGMYDDNGHLRNVGGIVSFTAKRRLELIDELAPLVETDDAGDALKGETDRSRFSSNKDVSFVRLRPEKVVEVKFDQLEGARFRHGVGFLRWRPDRDPESCKLSQVERAPAYDLGEVLR